MNYSPSHSGPGSEAAGNEVHLLFLKVPDDGISLILSSFPDRIRLESGLFHIGFQIVEFADINYGLTGTLAVLVKFFEARKENGKLTKAALFYIDKL